MLDVTTGTTQITYISRFNRIDKYTIFDHSTNITYSATTSILGYDDGRIYHTGITYQFEDNKIYTYTSFYKDDQTNIYYLANRTLLRSYQNILNNGDIVYELPVEDIVYKE